MRELSCERVTISVRAALTGRDAPVWFPTLTRVLASRAWRAIEAMFGLTGSTYATTRILSRNHTTNVEEAGTLKPTGPDRRGLEPIRVEIAPRDLMCKYDAMGIRFFDAKDLARGTILLQVQRALTVLDAVPTISRTIFSLVRSLHLIDAGDDDIDVSFSEPSLPFSAFVSVPRSAGPDAAGRVAESLLHEAMHLQLSLIEAVVPLVCADAGTYYSPWRDEHRSVQGVLHALYVFRVIDNFLAAQSRASVPALSATETESRRATIAAQIDQVAAFRYAPGLTVDGAMFAGSLIDDARLDRVVTSPPSQSRSPSR